MMSPYSSGNTSSVRRNSSRSRISGTASNRRRQPAASGRHAARSSKVSRSTSASVCSTRGGAAGIDSRYATTRVQACVEDPFLARPPAHRPQRVPLEDNAADSIALHYLSLEYTLVVFIGVHPRHPWLINDGFMELKGLNVGCFGGGTGLPSLLGGLKTNPWLTVNAIVTMFDSGGSSGQLRDELGVLPPGDVLKCALALARNEREARACCWRGCRCWSTGGSPATPAATCCCR